ncbi:hypothetical protein [Pararhizobium gei]|uniref:hypothetical protein n=1 Tax=Pararhizobium gei TaxID=1395951 RepID=UPI0023DA93E8|nr:hypothetical protein [Rhizobium gei]
MYRINFPQPNDDTPKIQLIAFLDEVERFLGDLVATGQDSQGKEIIIDTLRRPAMQRAWAGDPDMPGTSAADRFEQARQRINKMGSQRLTKCGLNGSALDFKLTVLNYRADQYNLEGGWKWFDKIIDLIDALLKSLFKAAGLDDAIEELKDFIWGSAEDDG